MSDGIRVISEKKIQRNERINGKTIKKNIQKYKAELTDELKHNVLLVGDSKVRHVENEMTDNTHLQSFWRSGAKLDNSMLLPHIDRHLNRYNKPIVLLWFNTCYLTNFITGQRKYIDLSDNNNIVNTVIDKYTSFKQRKIYAKSSSIIIFLECPFYSIIEWNRVKGHPNPAAFEESQIQLEQNIKELNNKIRELNLPYNAPRLAQDMVFRIKKRANHEQTVKLDYTLLTDGLHPDTEVSLLWLIRINNFVNRVNKL